MKNVELKVQVSDFSNIVALLKNSKARAVGLLSQKDTYFNCSRGRLKIREINNSGCELIYYQRPDVRGSRISNYQVVNLSRKTASQLKKLLKDSFGERGAVIKKRRLWLLGKTRIHLDQVKGLGNYVELETVFNKDGYRKAMIEHRHIISVLQLRGYKKIKGSYSDL